MTRLDDLLPLPLPTPSEPPASRPSGSSDAEHDPTRALRVKALACTAPLHDLQRNRGLRGWEAFDLYDLSLAAIDLVVDRMGFDSGIGVEELAGLLAAKAHRQVADAPRDQVREVADGVVSALIRPNTAEYTSDEDAVRRLFEFALLTEHERADGTIYLRATYQAINVLVGGLNVDVESAQVASEATLEHLLRRQRLADAALPAREAKIRSVQFADYVRRVIEDTKRDVRRAGWREDVPDRLEDIRRHLGERMDTERKMLAAIQETRDLAEREDLRQQAANLVDIVNDCFERHAELHRVTLEAARVYIEERDRQTFGRVAHVQGIDLTDELLRPVLAAPIERVELLMEAFAERLLGMAPGAGLKVTPWRQVSLRMLLTDLFREAQQREELGAELVEPTWEEPVADALAFTDEVLADGDRLLDALASPRRLSELLREAAAVSFDVADLVRLRALLATAPEIFASDPGRSILVAAPVGEGFATGRFAGDDLLVGTATVLRAAEVTAERMVA